MATLIAFGLLPIAYCLLRTTVLVDSRTLAVRAVEQQVQAVRTCVVEDKAAALIAIGAEQ